MNSTFKKITFIFFLLFFVVGTFFIESGTVQAIEIAETENEPKLEGPDRLCMIFGSVLGEFSAGGDAVLDRFFWRIINRNTGVEVFNRYGGSTFQNITINFDALGEYDVELIVRRGVDDIYSATKRLTVLQGPILTLEPDYLLCAGRSTTIHALSNQTPNIGAYTFEWRDGQGQVVGDQNELIVTQEGFYQVDLFLTGSEGEQDCLISGGTFVGPPLEFSLTSSATNVCSGGAFTLTPDNPLMGTWTAKKAGEDTILAFGNSLSLLVDVDDDLMGSGEYVFNFNSVDAANPDCNSERSIRVTVDRGPELTYQVLQESSGCNIEDGIFSLETTTGFDYMEIPSLGVVENNVGAGTIFEYENLSAGVYTIKAVKNNCAITRVVTVEDSDLRNEDIFDVAITGEICTDTGKSPGKIRFTFKSGVRTGTITLINERTGALLQLTIPPADSFTWDVPGGSYQFAYTDQNGCVFPRKEQIIVPSKNSVNFNVPSSLEICDSYEFIPSENKNLFFELLYPDGTTEIKPGGEAFTIQQAGEYTIVGSSQDTGSDICAKSEKFSITSSQNLVYEATILSQDCFGNRIYTAELENADIETVIIRWKDSNGTIVGRGPTWIPPSTGVFSLEIQPQAVTTCELSPYLFVVPQPVLQVDVAVIQEKFCADDPFTVLELVADDVEIFRTEWIFIDPDGEQTILDEFADLRSIVIEKEGIYEGVAYNAIDCELGRDAIVVEKLSSPPPPNLQNSYYICKVRDWAERLDPGEYQGYEWYQDGILVSTDRNFRPMEVGNYSLVVDDGLDCDLTENFTVFEECTFQYVMPTAMVLSDPARYFKIFFNNSVEKAQIWIHNRNGELIYSCISEDIIPHQPMCIWDGTNNGNTIPVGTYTVTLSYRSERFNIDEKLSQKLVVID